MNNLVPMRHSFLDDFLKPWNLDTRTINYPTYKELDNGDIVYAVEVPGAKKEDINITTEKNVISVQWSADILGKVAKKSKQFRVYDMIDIGKTEAKLEHGILYLTLKKKAEARAKTIQVQ